MRLSRACFLAYILLLREVDQRADLDYQSAAIQMALGANITEVPDRDKARDHFHRWLTSDPQHEDSDTQVKMRVLGLRPYE